MVSENTVAGIVYILFHIRNLVLNLENVKASICIQNLVLKTETKYEMIFSLNK